MGMVWVFGTCGFTVLMPRNQEQWSTRGMGCGVHSQKLYVFFLNIITYPIEMVSPSCFDVVYAKYIKSKAFKGI